MPEHSDTWHAAGDFLGDYYNYLKKMATGESETSVSTGLKDLDNMLMYGLEPQDLIILAGRPSMGKTCLAMNIARHAAINTNIPVAYFSLELGPMGFLQRLLMSMTKIHVTKFSLLHTLSQMDWDALKEHAGNLQHAPLYLDMTSVLTPEDIFKRVSTLAGKVQLGLVVIDSLQLLQIETTYDSIKDACGTLKTLAVEFNVPVLLLSQLSDEIDDRTSKVPMLSDLRFAGAIEKSADVIVFLSRDEAYNLDTEDKGIADIIVAKHKRAPAGMVRVNWVPEYATFADLGS
ncbi:MAG: DnaB-like helicase C-terminal domain-containing protein [Desulfomonilia bacterium]